MGGLRRLLSEDFRPCGLERRVKTRCKNVVRVVVKFTEEWGRHCKRKHWWVPARCGRSLHWSSFHRAFIN
jgi:hypothetical protein